MPDLVADGDAGDLGRNESLFAHEVTFSKNSPWEMVTSSIMMASAPASRLAFASRAAYGEKDSMEAMDLVSV
ncbi:MAG: hypothetical protein ACREDY_26080, partial [Bradyrhizobium sp.]